MTNKKYHRELKKIMSSHNYFLQRETKHFVFQHRQTRQKITCSKSPSICGMRQTMRIIEKQKKTG